MTFNLERVNLRVPPVVQDEGNVLENEFLELLHFSAKNWRKSVTVSRDRCGLTATGRSSLKGLIVVSSGALTASGTSGRGLLKTQNGETAAWR